MGLSGIGIDVHGSPTVTGKVKGDAKVAIIADQAGSRGNASYGVRPQVEAIINALATNVVKSRNENRGRILYLNPAGIIAGLVFRASTRIRTTVLCKVSTDGHTHGGRDSGVRHILVRIADRQMRIEPLASGAKSNRSRLCCLST